MKKRKSQTGSAMILALVTVLVTALACLSLFLAMSTALHNAGQEKAREQTRILALSLSSLVRDEIENGIVIEFEEDGTVKTVMYPTELAAYLNEQIGSAGSLPLWSWYNEDDGFWHNKENATRTFHMQNLELPKIHGTVDLTLTMYWTSSRNLENSGDYSRRKLHVTVRADLKGNNVVQQKTQSCSFTQIFEYQNKTHDIYWWAEEQGE